MMKHEAIGNRPDSSRIPPLHIRGSDGHHVEVDAENSVGVAIRHVGGDAGTPVAVLLTSRRGSALPTPDVQPSASGSKSRS